MSQRTRILAEIWGYRGWKVTDVAFERDGVAVKPVAGVVPPEAAIILHVERRWTARCAHCDAIGGRLHERLPTRRWRDLDWAGRPAFIEYAPVRVHCSRCDARAVERLAWADPHQRQSRRFQQRLALVAASAPVSHVAALYDLDWGTVRRAEGHALARWDRTRTPPPLRHLGIDEKYLGRRNALPYDYVTIFSNVETGEPVAIRAGRGEATVAAFLGSLCAAQKASIVLVVMDLHAPFRAAIRNDPAMAHAVVVHDPFHVLKRATEAVTEMRRATFFRAGAAMRAVGRGTRWLVLRAWEKCSAEERAQLRRLFTHNGKLARAYQIVEELRATLRAPSREAMVQGLARIKRRTEKRSNPALRGLHDSLERHREGILALGEHRPRAGRVEALNNNWETLVRRGRGYRDHEYLLLKLKFATATPIRNEDTARRFLELDLTPRSSRRRAA
ncbi:MAG TPA: ISL3 family transposase [Longimicrobium sp.]|nr:ISL3 family transposase [Longimicrobium sp.]